MSQTVAPETKGDLSFPIGRFSRPESLGAAERSAAIDAIGATPARLRDALRGLSDAQLDTPYRPGGWTVRQLAHHVPDSHVNAYIRFKVALTEHEPTIKPYDQDAWAQLADTREVPVDVSLALLDAVHARWVAVLRAMRPDDFERMLVHPESGRQRVDQMLALYAWHGPHHVAHITGLRERMGW